MKRKWCDSGLEMDIRPFISNKINLSRIEVSKFKRVSSASRSLTS